MLPSQEHTLKCCVLSRKGGNGDVTLGLGYMPLCEQGESYRTGFELNYSWIQSESARRTSLATGGYMVGFREAAEKE